jgi:hypothetical protein
MNQPILRLLIQEKLAAGQFHVACFHVWDVVMRQTHMHLARSRAVLAPTTRAIALTILLALGPHGAGAGAQTNECLEPGLYRSPSWALLSEASKQMICNQQEAMDRTKDEDRRDGVAQKLGRDVAGRSVSSSTITPISATPTALLPMTPRLTDEGRTLVLMDEVRAPSHQRQPEIRLGTNENTGAPQVQVAGASIAPPPTIAISCSWSRRSISLSNFSPGALRNVASYEVRENIAKMARDEVGCHIALGRTVLPLPRDMLSIVWPTNP